MSAATLTLRPEDLQRIEELQRAARIATGRTPSPLGIVALALLNLAVCVERQPSEMAFSFKTFSFPEEARSES